MKLDEYLGPDWRERCESVGRSGVKELGCGCVVEVFDSGDTSWLRTCRGVMEEVESWEYDREVERLTDWEDRKRIPRAL